MTRVLSFLVLYCLVLNYLGFIVLRKIVCTQILRTIFHKHNKIIRYMFFVLNSRGSIDSIRNVTVRSSIVYDPNNWNTVMALLKMRTKRVLRDIHKLYVMILLPVVFLATGIILNKLSHEIQPIWSIALSNSTCNLKQSLN